MTLPSLAFTKTLVAPSGEVWLKARRARQRMEEVLVGNIRYLLTRNNLPLHRLVEARGRVFLETDDPQRAAALVGRVFGVAYSMPVVEVPPSLPDIVRACVGLASATFARGRTFAVRGRRVGAHPFTSRDVEREAGAAILKELGGLGLRVDLEEPHQTIHVEVREGAAYVSNQVVRGPGGLPLGSQGKVVALLLGDARSAVAAWLIMRRGGMVLPAYFDSPYFGSSHRGRAVAVARVLREFATHADFKLAVVAHGPTLRRIAERGPRPLTCVLCRRAMYRVACRLAGRWGALAIATEEGVGQPPLGSLASMAILDAACTRPVFRPLVGMDAGEVLALADRLGVAQLAGGVGERCKLAPRAVGEPNAREVEGAEEELRVPELVEREAAEVEELLL